MPAERERARERARGQMPARLAFWHSLSAFSLGRGANSDSSLRQLDGERERVSVRHVKKGAGKIAGQREREKRRRRGEMAPSGGEFGGDFETAESGKNKCDKEGEK